MRFDEHGEIKDNASPKLGGLRTAIQIAKNRVKEKLDSILHDPNNQKYFMDNIVTMRGDRYVIPVKQEYKMNFPGIVHDQSGTGATLFIEPLAVVNLNNDIKRYVAEEHEEIERILRQLTQNVGAEAKALLGFAGNLYYAGRYLRQSFAGAGAACGTTDAGAERRCRNCAGTSPAAAEGYGGAFGRTAGR